jgi:hypothetical protein
VYAWSRRFNLTTRRITHRTQINRKKTDDVKCKIIRDYFEELQRITAKVPLTRIFNFDETPMYSDMVKDVTLSPKGVCFKRNYIFLNICFCAGAKSVEAKCTGHTKDRFTVCVCTCAAGAILQSLIVFKNRKTVPKIDPSDWVTCTACMSGTMNSKMVC